MKRILTIVLAALLALALFSFTGCAGEKETQSALTGEPDEIMAALMLKAAAYVTSEYGLPATFNDSVTAATAQGALGLSADDFEQYIESATANKGMIITTAHLVTLAKLKDPADAKTVMKLVAEGFDSGQWICVFPDESLVIASGPYLLLIASKTDWSNAVLTAFKELAGEYTKANTFYSGPGELGSMELLPD
ncbi:MAG: hypothetical protein FWF10_03190 [Clostridiales bacterium]|nr:hypothetical protein [Clostridiales bacterium]